MSLYHCLTRRETLCATSAEQHELYCYRHSCTGVIAPTGRLSLAQLSARTQNPSHHGRSGHAKSKSCSVSQVWESHSHSSRPTPVVLASSRSRELCKASHVEFWSKRQKELNQFPKIIFSDVLNHSIFHYSRCTQNQGSAMI